MHRTWEDHTLSDNNQTKITEHTDENPGMSAHHVAQEFGHTCEIVCRMLKKKGYFLYRISVLHKLQPEDYTPLTITATVFSKNLAAMSK